METIELARRFYREAPPAASHGRSVGERAAGIGRRLGFSPSAQVNLRLAGALHDVGKLGVPPEILGKAGPLDTVEWSQVRRHPVIGAEMLTANGLSEIAPWVRSHHERVDGLGYPDALQGSEIPVEARILAVADAFDAMTSDRPYAAAMSADDAREELRSSAGTQFDPMVIAAFLSDEAGEVRELDEKAAG